MLTSSFSAIDYRSMMNPGITVGRLGTLFTNESEMRAMNRQYWVFWVLALTLGGYLPLQVVGAADDEDAAVERTRKTVRMLDDVYKTAVVLITEHYVNDDDDLPAGSAAIALFDAIKKKGWHEVRLLDATGEPLEEKNSPKDDFEKQAIKQLTSGKNWHEAVIQKDGKRFLRAATPIPVVLEKCTMCHDNYKNVKSGHPIGALSYTIAIE